MLPSTSQITLSRLEESEGEYFAYHVDTGEIVTKRGTYEEVLLRAIARATKLDAEVHDPFNRMPITNRPALFKKGTLVKKRDIYTNGVTSGGVTSFEAFSCLKFGRVVKPFGHDRGNPWLAVIDFPGWSVYSVVHGIYLEASSELECTLVELGMIEAEYLERCEPFEFDEEDID